MSGSASDRPEPSGAVAAKALGIALGHAGLDPDVAAVAPAQLLQGLPERREAAERVLLVRDDVDEHTDAPHPLLKDLRRKLGSLPPGLTVKNENLLRRFDDPRLLRALIELPDRLWRGASREPPHSRHAFLLFQNALAIDVLIHAMLRMHNLCKLSYDRHLHWTQGQGKPVLLVFGADETKNQQKIEFELPAVLGDRLWKFRHSIAPRVIGSKPDRHLAAKVYLDQNPGGFELVRQLLGHKNQKTTVGAYGGINTKRAGRAHAELIMQIREQEFASIRRPRGKRKVEE